MEPIKLNATTLIDALSQAIKIAKEPNEEHFNAVCLKIFSDGTYYVICRCYGNVLFSSPVPITQDSIDLVVTRDDYPGKNWPFSLIEFCSMYSIRTSNRIVNDSYGRPLKNNWI